MNSNDLSKIQHFNPFCGKLAKSKKITGKLQAGIRNR